MIFYTSKSVFIARTFADLKGWKKNNFPSNFHFLIFFFFFFFCIGSSFIETIKKNVFWLDVTDYDQENLETLAKVDSLLFV